MSMATATTSTKSSGYDPTTTTHAQHLIADTGLLTLHLQSHNSNLQKRIDDCVLDISICLIFVVLDKQWQCKYECSEVTFSS